MVVMLPAGSACQLAYCRLVLDDPGLCPGCRRRPRAARRALPGMRRSRRCERSLPSWASGWPGWSGRPLVTAATPRCRRRLMTCRVAVRRASSGGRPGAPASAGAGSSRARRGRRCAGPSLMRPGITTCGGRARAARAWRACWTWEWPGRSGSWTWPGRPRGGSSMTCTWGCAAAAASTWPPGRPGCRTRRCRSARICVPWRSAWWSSSTCRWSGAGT
jgi:hypothetical protein